MINRKLTRHFCGNAYRMSFAAIELLFSKWRSPPKSDIVKLKELNVPNYRNVFCGYYDVSPFNPECNDLMIVHANKISPFRRPSANDKTAIFLVNLSSLEFTLIGETTAWNWQQGARAQWLSDSLIAYNVRIKNQICACLHDIDTSEKTILSHPISNKIDGRHFISINFDLLSAFTEYGYAEVPLSDKVPWVKKCSIWGDKCESLLQLDVTTETGVNKGRPRGGHINHTSPSPNGKFFVFIYRYWLDECRKDSLYCFCLESGILRCLIKDEIVSHYYWRTEEELIAWVNIRAGGAYYRISLEKGGLRRIWSASDGHPNYLSSTSFITDRNIGTKLSAKSIRAEVYDLERGSATGLFSVSHPKWCAKTVRCDMHISVSNCRTKIQADSWHWLRYKNVVVAEL